MAVRLFSTLLPQLPKADLEAFRIALLAGLAVVAVLAIAGLYPVALVAAALIVPLLVVLYLYDVDVYEDEPITVIAATMAWGAAAGVVAAIVGGLIAGPGSSAGTGAPEPLAVVRDGILVPLAQLAVILVGPLLLLRFRRFNDVLDGAMFGVASAVSFAGAYALVTALELLQGGLRPGGDPLPWILSLLTVAVIRPILLAVAAGPVAAAFWLRYRAPVTDRDKLGIVGRPVAAIVVAGSLLVAASLAGLLFDRIAAMLVGGGLAAVGLVWLRRAIHLGLLQEAREVTGGGPIACSNCGRSTPRHTFCGHCGIALRALPGRPGDRAATRAEDADVVDA